jgi:hypothetical protein
MGRGASLIKKNAHIARATITRMNICLRGLVVCGLCGCMASGYVSNKSTYYSAVERSATRTSIQNRMMN